MEDFKKILIWLVVFPIYGFFGAGLSPYGAIGGFVVGVIFVIDEIAAIWKPAHAKHKVGKFAKVSALVWCTIYGYLENDFSPLGAIVGLVLGLVLVIAVSVVESTGSSVDDSSTETYTAKQKYRSPTSPNLPEDNPYTQKGRKWRRGQSDPQAKDTLTEGDKED